MSSNSRITSVQRRCLTYLLDKNYNSAIKLLTTLILKYPNNNILKLNRAISYIEISYYNECIVDCKDILETDPFELKAIILYEILVEGREIHADITLHIELENLISEINSKTINITDIEKENQIGKATIKAPILHQKATMEDMKKNMKLSVIKNLIKVESSCLRVDDKIGLGQMKINTGNYKEAIEWFSNIINNECFDQSKLFVCHMCRGSAYAFLNECDLAIRDFSRAVDIDDTKAEAFKRRGQTKAAKGLYKDALKDLTKAAELGTIFKKDHEVFFQRGLIIYKMHDFSKAMTDFKSAVSLEPRHQASWNYLGLCSQAVGDIKEASGYYENVLALDSKCTETLYNAALAFIELGEPESAVIYFKRLLAINPRHADAFLQRATLNYKIGLINESIDDFVRSISLNPNNSQTLYAQGIAYHSLGAFSKAIECYSKCLGQDKKSKAYYQREILYLQLKYLNLPLLEYNEDDLLDPNFKSSFVRKFPIESLVDFGYKPLLKPDVVENIFFLPEDSTPEIELVKVKADKIGTLFNLNSTGIIHNSKLARGYGLSTLLMTESLIHSIINPGNNKFGWKDMVDIFVKIRQLNEPSEPTFWLNKLSVDVVSEGFSLQHPIVNGQNKILKTKLYYNRTMTLMKSLMPSQCVLPEKKSLHSCNTLYQLYDTVNSDFAVITQLHPLKPGFVSASDIDYSKTIEGTTISLMEKDSSSYIFTVSTPSCPSRWLNYSEVLDEIFNLLTALLEDYHFNKLLDLEAIEETAAMFFYYFINFGPISHGVYQAGLACWYAFLLAFDQIVVNAIPKDVLLDWEVYLSESPFQFNQYLNVTFPRIEFDKDFLPSDMQLNKLIYTPKSVFQILS